MNEPEQQLIRLAMERIEILTKLKSIDRQIDSQAKRLKQKRLGKSY